MLDKYDHNLLLGYVEDDLSPKDRARVEKMLGSDPQLATLLASMIADRSALRTLPPEVAPANLMEQVNLRLERQMLLDEPAQFDEVVRTHKTFRLHRALIYSGLAAMVLISAGVVVQTLMPVPWFDQLTPGTPSPGPGSDSLAMHKPGEREGVAAAPPLLTPIEREHDLTDAIQADRPAVDAAPLARDTGPAIEAVPGHAMAMKGGLDARARQSDQPFEMNETRSNAGASLAVAPVPAATAPPISNDGETEPVFFARLVSVSDQETAAETTQVAMKSSRAAMPVASPTPGNQEAAYQLRTPAASPVVVCIDTDDAGQTHRELVTWAIDNNARVLPAQRMESKAGYVPVQGKMAKSAAPAQSPVMSDNASSPSAAAGDQQVLVVVTGSQIPELVEFLNGGRDRQFADIVPADTIASTAAEQVVQDGEPTRVEASPDEAAISAEQRQLLTPAEPNRRLAIDLSNGWGKLLQQQLPLSPRSAVFGDADELILPVRINVDPALASPEAAEHQIR